MNRLLIRFALGLAALALTAAAQQPEPAVETGDVGRFYSLYGTTGGHPTAEQLQAYIDGGSEGLHQLARLRRVTGAAMADAMVKRPEIYVGARRCAAVLPRVRTRLLASFRKLGELYPEARFPPMTIAVGRGKPVAIGSPITGVQVGLEALCAADTLGSDPEERFVHVIAHEYAHTQQNRALVDDEHPTVLEMSIVEGVAEFVAELTSGSVSNTGLAARAKGRELEIETAFVPDEDKTDTSKWLYNGLGTQRWPGDLGYWVGYRIAKAYYLHAPDKRQALKDILQMDDPKALLAKSGWYPGIKLD